MKAGAFAVVVALTRAHPHARVFLAGNWDADGRRADLLGYAPVAMTRAAPDRWEAAVRLEPTRDARPYRAFLRTDRWPKGEALGDAIVYVNGPARVEVPERPHPAAGVAAAAPDARPAVDVAVLCLDGLSWNVLLPLIYQGKLPHLARLFREGASANLAAFPVAHRGERYPSLPNIYAAMTGKRPERNGADAAWWGLRWRRRAQPLWRIASAGGASATVIGVLATFPPSPLQGALVSDAALAIRAREAVPLTMLNVDADVFQFARKLGVGRAAIRRLLSALEWIAEHMDTTYPASLAAELRSRVAIPVLSGERMTHLARLVDDETYGAAEYLTRARPTSAVVAYLAETDTAGHSLWERFEPGRTTVDPEAPAESLDAAYVRADRLVGLLSGRARNVIVFGDHGFAAVPRPRIAGFDPRRLLDSFHADRQLPRTPGLEMSRSASGWGFRLPASPAHARLLASLAGYLREVRLAPRGASVFTGVRASEEGGWCALRFGVLPLASAEALWIAGERRSLRACFAALSLEGEHAPVGALLLRGPRVRAGRLSRAASVADVAPTALYLLGLPVARDMDGHVIEDALRPGALAREPIREVDGFGAEGVWRAYLRAFK